MARGGADGLREHAEELGIAAEARIEGVLEHADFGVGVDAAEKLLQADLVAVGGEGEAGLSLEEGAEMGGGQLDGFREPRLGDAPVGIGQEGEDGLELGVEGGAIADAFGGEKFVPKGQQGEIEAAVERVGAGTGGDGREEAIDAAEGGGGEPPAIGNGRDAWRGRVLAAGGEEAGRAGGIPFDDPEEHVGGP